MALVAQSQEGVASRPDVALFGGYKKVPYADVYTPKFDVTRKKIGLLKYGQDFYPLRQPLEGTFIPATGGRIGQFMVGAFGQEIVGLGVGPKDGYQDWLRNFHVAFQHLYTARPFELDDSEKALWDMIGKNIDLDDYRTAKDLIVRQEGKVVRGEEFPTLVQWEDGTRERVPLNRAPGEFVTYRVGQPFEAVVHRDPVTYRIRRIDSVNRLRSLPHERVEKSRELLESIPTSECLPDASWD